MRRRARRDPTAIRALKKRARWNWTAETSSSNRIRPRPVLRTWAMCSSTSAAPEGVTTSQVERRGGWVPAAGGPTMTPAILKSGATRILKRL